MAAASSTTSQSACSSLAIKASGAIKRNFSPANCASTSVAAFAGAVTIALPAIREISCPANADLPRPRAAVTAATPGGMVSSCCKSCCCSGCGAPVAGCQSVRGSKMRQRERLVLPPEDSVVIRRNYAFEMLDKMRRRNRVRAITPAQRVGIRLVIPLFPYRE